MHPTLSGFTYLIVQYCLATSVAQQWVLGVRKYHFPLENDIFSPLKTPLRGGAAAEQY